MKTIPPITSLALALLLVGCNVSLRDTAETPGPGRQWAEPGHPRQVVFRADSPSLLEVDQDKIDMVVSDHHVWTRNYGHEEFARNHPGTPVLIHAGGDFMSANAYTPRQFFQDRGLLDGEFTDLYIAARAGFAEILQEDFVPAPGFLGYWVYEAGVDTKAESLPGQIISLKVPDVERFAPRLFTPPSIRRQMRELTGSIHTNHIVVLCPRDGEGALDWLRAELAEVIETNAEEGTITVRRFNTGESYDAIPSGTYVAASVQVWDRPFPWGFRSSHVPDSHPLKSPFWPFFLPNFTPLCPVDPTTGLNAAQWFARHFVERKQKYFPYSSGYALDVTTDTHFPKPQHIELVDINHDGVTDRGFVDGINWWALGFHDSVYYMREGVEGVFEGLGRDLLVTWDSTDNNSQRLFHLLNGAEYEHTMIMGAGWGPTEHMYSSRLDRLLLWSERALEPNITFISNKQPNEAFHGGTPEELAEAQKIRPNYALHYARLDMASSSLASGYTSLYARRSVPAHLSDYPGRRDEEAEFGVPRIKDYDEFTRGDDGVRHWLGQPIGPPMRYRMHLGPVGYAFTKATELPVINSLDPAWKAAPPERTDPNGFRVDIREIGSYLSGDQTFTLTVQIPLDGMQLEEMAEYAVSFNLSGSSPFGDIAPRYRPIPRNISLRLKVGDRIYPEDARTALKAKGLYQEVLAFEEPRRVDLTLQAPASGVGVLEICISEVPGTVEISDIEIRPGCADILYREFENGLVLVNGSSISPAGIDVQALFPEARFRRIQGTQDPVHNSGEPAPKVVLGFRDGIFLQRESSQ